MESITSVIAKRVKDNILSGERWADIDDLPVTTDVIYRCKRRGYIIDTIMVGVTPDGVCQMHLAATLNMPKYVKLCSKYDVEIQFEEDM
jgi:hypothetical protein